MCKGCKHESACRSHEVTGLMPQPASCCEPVGHISFETLRAEASAPPVLRVLAKPGHPAQPAP